MTIALEQFPIRCNVVLIASDPETGEELERVYAHNVITTRGKELVAAMLAEEAGRDTGLTFGEIGTGTNVPIASDTALQTPLTRKAVTRYIRTSNVLQIRVFYTAAESTANIKEVGLFGHSTATATIGTGDLFNRAAVAFDNSAGTKDLTIVHQITFG